VFAPQLAFHPRFCGIVGMGWHLFSRVGGEVILGPQIPPPRLSDKGSAYCGQVSRMAAATHSGDLFSVSMTTSAIC
jgi:hypothetical protein